ncbi:copper amine oxidase N-terminal domain-containing protein [Ureibacillus sp. FSL K6-8385]|uniref:Copper amine oxidase N-terminal domain-containing protein n=1 Tax=Ureibacillus terrenus TaxID=118246 RepID=A0A540V3E7_9BACL|nr:copper amine oxidase N-terminal domain-containing protein [Ureibacillus terrenus]MED3662862.1 copper amine oxidase N-terminal domain-containing protein [Ureibacillus terrenus]MED3763846.1 copper amine oxidase N-terminal domain-containing protein [Ureibacillus terrenus]TQE91260.1 copper amine oxidase N-terminal domain-containing protein [Ureibacillus terrenus]
MKTRISKWVVFCSILCLLFLSVNVIAYAKDHHKYKDDYNYLNVDHDGYYKIDNYKVDQADYHYREKFEKYDDNDDYFGEKFRKHDDDDDDDYKWGRSEYNFQGNLGRPSYWNIWTRDTNVTVSNNLPVQEAKTVPFELDGKTTNLLVLPSDGQLLVSGEKMADFLGIKSKFYGQSRILELSKNGEELIVRAGTNAAYENMVKTPLPTKAIYYEKTVYLPVSVIANAFGYSVDWDESTGTFTLEQFK